jgi:C4-dicarboxylate-specific signal transduction histidine kinase
VEDLYPSRCSGSVDQEGVEPLQISQVIESAAKMALTEINYRAELVLQLEATPPVKANEGRLSQVFLNLLINTAQAIKEGDASANA